MYIMRKDTVRKMYLGVAFVLILCATCFSGCVAKEEMAQVDHLVHEWMDTEMTDAMTGETFTLRELTTDETSLVVHIFATWCPACNMQLTESTTFLENYPGKARVVSIDIDAKESPAHIAEHAISKEYKGIFTTAEQPIVIGLVNLFGQEIVMQIPQTVLFNGDTILYLGAGIIGSKDLADRLDAMLQQLAQ
jgi:thiol-disulfide isomerase/thioredoxin